MGRERETMRRRDEDEDVDVGGPKKKRKGGRSQKIHQAPPSPLRPTANFEIVDGDDVGFDWRKKIIRGQPVLPPVGDQEGLSTCWVFSTLDVIETIHKIKTGKKIQLSKQYLIDFVWPKDHFDTGRGYSSACTLDHIKNEGITFEHVYPYVHCRQNKMKMQFKDLFHIKDYGTVIHTADISRILRDRPLIIRSKFDRSFMDMKDWSIYIPKTDANLSHPHGLVLVGEGTETKDGAQLNYWIVKNSWGDKWGERGFGRIIKDDNNLKIEAWYPILLDDELPPG